MLSARRRRPIGLDCKRGPLQHLITQFELIIRGRSFLEHQKKTREQILLQDTNVLRLQSGRGLFVEQTHTLVLVNAQEEGKEGSSQQLGKRGRGAPGPRFMRRRPQSPAPAADAAARRGEGCAERTHHQMCAAVARRAQVSAADSGQTATARLLNPEPRTPNPKPNPKP